MPEKTISQSKLITILSDLHHMDTLTFCGKFADSESLKTEGNGEDSQEQDTCVVSRRTVFTAYECDQIFAAHSENSRN